MRMIVLKELQAKLDALEKRQSMAMQSTAIVNPVRTLPRESRAWSKAKFQNLAKYMLMCLSSLEAAMAATPSTSAGPSGSAPGTSGTATVESSSVACGLVQRLPLDDSRPGADSQPRPEGSPQQP